MSIEVIDQSETMQAEIAIGKNLTTGEWVASIYFDPEITHELRRFDAIDFED